MQWTGIRVAAVLAVVVAVMVGLFCLSWWINTLMLRAFLDGVDVHVSHGGLRKSALMLTLWFTGMAINTGFSNARR
jgi:hypothetical protein